MEKYITVKKYAEAEITEQRSRFISAVKPVTTEEEAIEFINERKQKYWDARHNVYAYVIRDKGIARFSDDGEPHSTAGKPTLEVLTKQGITDAVIVTTRYFGGVLLGTGGLVRCYSKSAADAVIAAEIGEMRPCICCEVECEYPQYEKLQKTVVEAGAVLENTEFLQNIKIYFSIEAEHLPLLSKKLNDIFAGKLKIKEISEKYTLFDKK